MFKIKCIKEFAGDKDQYGIDCLVSNIYNAINDNDIIYIETENGNNVMLTPEEFPEYFMMEVRGFENVCCHCAKQIDDGFDFCIECEDQNYHFCEECGKVINHSTWSKEEECLLCDECLEKYNNQ